MHPILQGYFKLIRRLLPAEHLGSVVGLDLTPEACHVVEVAGGGNFCLNRCFSVPLVNGDERATLQKVAGAFEKTLAPRVFVTSLGGRGTLARFIEMPRMPVKDLKKAFLIEADRYFPFPKETIYTECHGLDPECNDKKMQVLIAAAKKDLVDVRLKVLAENGIETSALTLDAVAIANVFIHFPPAIMTGVPIKGSGVSAVVSIGENVTSLIVFLEGRPLFSRDIFIGVAEMVRRAGTSCGLDSKAARKALGSAERIDANLKVVIDMVTQSLVSEVRLSFDYFVTEKNLPITRLCVIGEGVFVPGVETAFAHAFDIPVVVWDPFEKMPVGPQASKEELALCGRRMITALGLALNEYDQN